MSDQALSTDPVDYPSIRIGGKETPIRISCATLLRLKKSGLNLFEQPPASAEFDVWLALYNEYLAAASAEPQDPTVTEPLRQRVLGAWEAVPQERRDWKAPLDRGDRLEQMETACKVIAAVVATEKDPVTAMEIAEQLDLSQLGSTINTLAEAVKKVSAPAATA